MYILFNQSHCTILSLALANVSLVIRGKRFEGEHGWKRKHPVGPVVILTGKTHFARQTLMFLPPR